ncbi:unnamed protein product, partial [Brenthis ino]
MEKQDEGNLDEEYKRYLEIVRPYLSQLLDQDVIDLCNAWVQKLCNSKRNEKILRNKYMCSLYYQLSRGILEKPFVCKPDFEILPPLPNQIYDESSTELEYLLVDLDNTKVLFNNGVSSVSATDNLDGSEETKCERELKADSDNAIVVRTPEQNFCSVKCKPNNRDSIFLNFNTLIHDHDYQSRIKNLIMKFRNIKEQNLRLNEEIALMKEIKRKNDYDDSYEEITKLDTSTSAYISSEKSSTTLKSLKSKLEEAQASRNMLIENISNLKERLDNYDDMKKYEIEDIKAKHKVEIIQIETAIRDELRAGYEKKLAEVKKHYEDSINTIEKNKQKEIENIAATKDEIISQKDKIINMKNEEIAQLKCYSEDLKHNRTPKSTPRKIDLEKCLSKLEKSKAKCCKAYEAKILNLKREKHLAECSLQLQLVKQRAQIVNEVTDEHQLEVSTALEKLESKYKDIVANVQATAVQRRIQDQMVLESLIQTVCGVHKEGSTQPTYQNQLKDKVMCSQIKTNCDIEFSSISQGNRVGSVIVGNNCTGTVNDCYLDSEKMRELNFEKMHIPQRDSGNT